MLARLPVHLVLLGVALVLVSSCAQKERAERGEAEAGYAAWVPPGKVPPMLLTIGARADDVITAAAGDDWPRVYADVRDISNAWADYQHPTIVPLSFPRPPGTLLYGEMDAALARLKDAAADRRKLATMRAANDVDAAAADLQEYYHPAVPPDLHKLRTLERRIVLDAAEGKLDGTSETLSRARSAWRRVRPIVAANSSPNVVATLDERLDAQQAALDAANRETLGEYARQTIDLVREMERLTY